ncbi:MAG: hypothetical protein COA90_09065 [Gammaproteobacteria bacterium]|nr:MAG: hypothetical protein COA90_09065 [Gammaproteobacteria bacterium]
MALLSKLLEIANIEADVQNLEVSEMNDGGMGSLAIGSNYESRMLGREVAEYSFNDLDGMHISATLNIDRDNQLYEIDIFKADFSPTLCLK